MAPVTPRLAGRDHELAEVEQALLHLGERGPGLVLVTGPCGIGRTAVADALAARHDGPVLRARAAPWESDRPGGVLAQLLGSTPPTDPFEAADAVASAAAAAGEAGGDEGAARHATLVVVDDAHWADRSSLQALATAARHRRAEPCGVVLLARTPEPRSTWPVDDLLHREAGHQVDLAPLDPPAVAALAAGRGVPLAPAHAELLCRHTGGLPRHIVDLLGELPRELWAEPDLALPAPAAVARKVREQLAACGRPARALVEAGAVLGPAPLAQAAALAGIGQPWWPALADAVDHGLLTWSERDRRVGTPSPMVSAAVLADLGPQAVAERHRRAAEVVADAAESLHHLAAATPGADEALADRMDAVAAERARAGEWAVAARLLTDASGLTPAGPVAEDRFVRATDALVGAGEALTAATRIPRVESLRETPLRNAVLGYLAVIRGRAAEAELRLDRAWDLVNADRDPQTAALVCQRRVLHALARCEGAELVAWADRAITLAGREAPPAVEAAAIRGLGVAAAGQPARATEDYAALARRVRHGAQGQRVRMGQGWLHLVTDRVDEARSALESAIDHTYLGGSSRISLWAVAWLARVQFLRGEWEEALHAVAHGRMLVDRTGMLLASPLLAWTETQVHALRGDWERAAESLRAAEQGAPDYEIMRVPAMIARAQVAEAQADYVAVRRALEPLTEPWAGGGALVEPGFWPWTDVYANALVLLGDLAGAEEFLDRHEGRAVARGHRSTRARLGYARGRLYGARGDPDRARDSFEASLDLLAGLPLPYDRARVNFAYGQTLRRAGKRREADAVISTARDLYQSLGALTYVRRCERELKAGGLHLSRGDRDAVRLTPQEEAVAGLVARGLSNREVAAELYLSTKTVQYHLTRIYAKLGVRSRSELAALRGSATAE